MSEMVVSGVVQVLAQNKAKFWNVKIDDDWYSIGKDAPKFKKGATIQFSYTKNGNWNNGDPKSVEVVEDAAPVVDTKSSSSSAEDWGARAKYWENKDKQDVLRNKETRYRFCLATAKDIVLAAVDSGALVLSKAAKKNAAYDSLNAYIDKAASDMFFSIEEFMNENALEDSAKYALPDDSIE